MMSARPGSEQGCSSAEIGSKAEKGVDNEEAGQAQKKGGEEQKRNFDGGNGDLPDPRAVDTAVGAHHPAVEHSEHDDRPGECAPENESACGAARRPGLAPGRRPRSRKKRSGNSSRRTRPRDQENKLKKVCKTAWKKLDDAGETM